METVTTDLAPFLKASSVEDAGGPLVRTDDRVLPEIFVPHFIYNRPDKKPFHRKYELLSILNNLLWQSPSLLIKTSYLHYDKT